MNQTMPLGVVIELFVLPTVLSCNLAINKIVHSSFIMVDRFQ